MDEVMGDEINNGYLLNPQKLLEDYPALVEILQKRTEKMKEVLHWREADELIQYQGFTCKVHFNWRHARGKYFAEAVNIKAISKAPKESDQYEIE